VHFVLRCADGRSDVLGIGIASELGSEVCRQTGGGRIGARQIGIVGFGLAVIGGAATPFCRRGARPLPAVCHGCPLFAAGRARRLAAWLVGFFSSRFSL
jgi:hypothetical protein